MPVASAVQDALSSSDELSWLNDKNGEHAAKILRDQPLQEALDDLQAKLRGHARGVQMFNHFIGGTANLGMFGDDAKETIESVPSEWWNIVAFAVSTFFSVMQSPAASLLLGSLPLVLLDTGEFNETHQHSDNIYLPGDSG